MPRVTVIIPTYNYSTVLHYAVASVLRQTMTDFELLVIGDCCTDNSSEIVAAFNDPRVTWINLEKNTGEQSGPNSEGIRRASAPVIAYVNHDDLMMPHHLEVLCAVIEAGAVAAHGIVANIQVNDLPAPGLQNVRPYNGDGFLAPAGVAHRTDAARAIGGWRHSETLANGWINSDTDFFQRLHAEGNRFELVHRLVAIKFPAIDRKDCYRDKPCHEQKEWTDRILNDPDLETTLLVDLMEHLDRMIHEGRVYGVSGHAREMLRSAVLRAREIVFGRPNFKPGDDMRRRRTYKGVRRPGDKR